MVDLVSLEDYKTYKGISSKDQDDQTRYIASSVSVLVKNYCNRFFIDYFNTSLVVYSDGTDCSEEYLDEFPIKQVDSVEVSSDGGVTYTLLVENTDYFVDTSEDKVLTYSGSTFSKGIPHRSLKITYTGGYDKIPEDLKIACLDFMDYYREEQFNPKKSMGRSLGEIVQHETLLIPPHIKRVLDLYRLIP